MDQRGDIRITERQRAILSIIVEQYVSTARPVASEQLVNNYGLNVSSATVLSGSPQWAQRRSTPLISPQA